MTKPADGRGFPESTDVSVLERAKKGDQNAWTVLVNVYSPTVYAICRRNGFDPQMSEDLTQVAFEKVWRALPKFQRDSPVQPDFGQETVSSGNASGKSQPTANRQPRRRFKYWLRTVLANAIIDNRRKEIRRHENRPIGGDDADHVFKNIRDQISDEATFSVADNVYIAALGKVLATIQKKIKPNNWRAFELVYFEQMTTKDAAEHLNASEKALRVAVHRIRNKIKDELGDLF